MYTLIPFTHLIDKEFFELIMFYFDCKLKKNVLHGQMAMPNMAYLELEAKISVSGVNNERRCMNAFML